MPRLPATMVRLPVVAGVRAPSRRREGVHQALCGCLLILVENILPKKRSSPTPPTTQRRNPPTKTAIAPHKSYSGDERIAYVEPGSWRIAEAVSALSIIAIVATVAVPRISR